MTECITNPSLLSPNKFAIIIDKFPAVQFFAQRVFVPSITLGETRIYTNQDIDFWLPGDKLTYDDLVIDFLIDEDLLAFSQLKQWMHDITNKKIDPKSDFSDIRVIAMTNNNNANRQLVFKASFPANISSFVFDTTRAEDVPLTQQVTFKYSLFDIE